MGSLVQPDNRIKQRISYRIGLAFLSSILAENVLLRESDNFHMDPDDFSPILNETMKLK